MLLGWECVVNETPAAEHQSAGAAGAELQSEIEFDVSKAFPDVYTDSVQVSIGPFGMSLTFALTDPRDATHRDVIARIRLSPQMGFVTAQLLRKVLKKAKADGIGIDVPDEVLRSLDLDREL